MTEDEQLYFMAAMKLMTEEQKEMLFQYCKEYMEKHHTENETEVMECRGGIEGRI